MFERSELTMAFTLTQRGSSICQQPEIRWTNLLAGKLKYSSNFSEQNRHAVMGIEIWRMLEPSHLDC